MFFTDFSLHLNELNVKLQGFGKSVDVMFGMIRCFERKRTFQRDLESGAFKYFPRVKLLFNEASRENIEQHVAQFVEFLKSVIDQFSSRFLQFRQVEKTIQLIKYPDEI